MLLNFTNKIVLFQCSITMQCLNFFFKLGPGLKQSDWLKGNRANFFCCSDLI